MYVESVIMYKMSQRMQKFLRNLKKFVSSGNGENSVKAESNSSEM